MLRALRTPKPTNHPPQPFPTPQKGTQHMTAPNPQTILNHAATMRTFNQNPDHNDLTKLLHEMAQTILHLHQRLQTLETTPAQPTTTRTPLIYEEQ